MLNRWSVAVLLCFATGSALAQDAPTPKTFILATEENVWDVAVEDVDQNGLKDILVLTCDEKSRPLKKALAVFNAQPDGTYLASPTTTLVLPEELGAVFLAEIDGKPGRELVAVDAHGATTYAFSGTTLEKSGRVKFNSLFPSHSKEPLFLTKATVDLDGDGIDEWLIPQPSGYLVRTADKEVATVACDVISEFRRSESTYIYHRLPDVLPFTLPGADQKGLAFLSDEVADFAYGKQWTDHRHFEIPIDLEEKWEANAKMEDVNNDGFPDLLVNQTRGTVNLESLTQLYIASAPFTYPDKPSATFSAKGAVSAPGLKDVDGDGDKDIIVIRVPFGVKTMINYFVRGKIGVEADVYLYNGSGYGDKPDYSTTLTLGAPEGREEVAHALDDFNGDGRMDLVFSEGANELAFHAGNNEDFLDRKPWLTLDLPAFGIAEPHDLNGNAAQDVILIHPAADNAKRVDVIVF